MNFVKPEEILVDPSIFSLNTSSSLQINSYISINYFILSFESKLGLNLIMVRHFRWQFLQNHPYVMDYYIVIYVTNLSCQLFHCRLNRKKQFAFIVVISPFRPLAKFYAIWNRNLEKITILNYFKKFCAVVGSNMSNDFYCNKHVLLLTHSLILNVCLTTGIHSTWVHNTLTRPWSP